MVPLMCFSVPRKSRDRYLAKNVDSIKKDQKEQQPRSSLSQSCHDPLGLNIRPSYILDFPRYHCRRCSRCAKLHMQIDRDGWRSRSSEKADLVGTPQSTQSLLCHWPNREVETKTDRRLCRQRRGITNGKNAAL